MVLPMHAPPQSVLHTKIAHVSKASSSNTHTHTQYVIRVSDERTANLNWTVYRRYSEFRAFRRRLEEAVKRGDMCSHCEIMSKRTSFMQFPHRRLFGSTRESVLESRRVGLNAFLDAVARHARTCRESTTCQTRPLMDQFLDFNDMRYTYLNVNMGDSDDDFHGKINSCTSTASAPTPNRLFSYSNAGSNMRGSVRESRYSSFDGALPVDAFEIKTENQETTEEIVQSTDDDVSPSDTRVLTGRKTSLPNLLDYSRSSRVSRNSFVEDLAAANRPSRLSDWDAAKFQTNSGRLSDPGSNELLRFSGCATTGRRSEQRNRVRRVHLSSAAKRVKKLEEQEARFSCRPPPKHKKQVSLPPIQEEESILEEDEDDEE